MPSLQRLREATVSRVGVDERALAALRVLLATVVLVDVALSVADATAFYTDAGVLPRDLLYAEFPVRGPLSLHSLSGELWWQYVAFALVALAAVAMLVGYRSRLATALTLVLVLSMQFRNPYVLNSGHALLRRLLLWSVLLPVGARWSLDARRRTSTGTAGTGDDEERSGSTVVASVATVGVVVQVLVVYAMNAVLKSRGPAWRSGDAAELVFGMDAITVLLGDALAGQSFLLELGTHAWVLLLYAAPLLVLATGRLRALVAGAFVAAHLAMAATLYLGAFPFVSIAGLLVFLPPFVWDRVEGVVAAHFAGRATAVATALGRARSAVAARTPSVPRPTWWRDAASVTLSRARAVGRTAYRVLPVVVLAAVLVWNAAGFGLLALPADATETVDPKEYRWDMFAPYPLSSDAWYATVGTTESGERVDLYAGAAGRGPPADVDGTYPSQKWYLYLRNVRGGDVDDRRDRFAQYLCERWNRRHASTLATVNVTLVTENVRLGGDNEIGRETFGGSCKGATTRLSAPDATRAREPKPISPVVPERLA
ncbi:HTTM domain-containing protein [Halorubellus litoreus]|uniref:HTTM domain-containing protein n=1 Tax=Halorubellus litoreus TaxID=755308 RepID=A0ABD5VDV7_9EURY